MDSNVTTERRAACNSSYKKLAVQCSADTFVVNQSLVVRINICGGNRQLLVAAKRYRPALDCGETERTVSLFLEHLLCNSQHLKQAIASCFTFFTPHKKTNLPTQEMAHLLLPLSHNPLAPWQK